MKSWQFWIDVGGTFTDCLAVSPEGTIHTHKLLSSARYKGNVGVGSSPTTIIDPLRSADPAEFFVGYTFRLAEQETVVRGFDAATGTLELATPLSVAPDVGQPYELVSPEEAPVAGIRWLLGKRLSDPIGQVNVRLGTTKGTNALLERQGARTAFVTTAGLGDVLRIGYQTRPKLFQLDIRRHADLYVEVIEVDERMDSSGQVLTPINASVVRQQLLAAQQRGIKSLAVCLMNGYRNDAHEQVIATLARELGFEHVSCGVTQLQKLVTRANTTVVDAYLTPVIQEYLAGIRRKLPEGSLKLMTSAGGLVDVEHFIGKDSILSGPAGGVIGHAYAATEAGFAGAIGFDMGGTSTDVSRFDGQYERRYEMEVTDPESGDGVQIVAPMLSIETVAAGGGSICWFDGQKLMVGPQSAGATPGPACYGAGGPLSVTDLNVFLGKVLPDRFAFPLDRQAVQQRLEELIAEVQAATGQRYTPETLAAGLTDIANANMAAAIKKISIARGYDTRDYVLVSFGGAGAQHACAIARELGIRQVLEHPYAGILSAFGIGMADVKKFAARDVSRPYNMAELDTLDPLFVELESSLIEQVVEEGIAHEQIQPPVRSLDLRYAGQDNTITIDRPDDGDYLQAFATMHRQLFGFTFDRPVEIHAARVEVTGQVAKPHWPVSQVTTSQQVTPTETTRSFFAGQWYDTGVYQRDDLQPGDLLVGPAIVIENTSTVVVEPGWECIVTPRNDLLLTDRAGGSEQSQLGSEVDPIALELFNNRFAAIAEQMGVTLQMTALSTNIKQRLDFSCAIFDPNGDLVVNAPHIPVHLGAMSECVQCLMADVPDMSPGDVFVTNDPFRGGSHLPDVTVVTPVFGHADDQQPPRLLFFTASRAHHSEIGGITPGSMPPFSRHLSEEGVLIRRFRLAHQQQSNERELRQLLSSGAYPSRSVDENLADIHAQAAANQSGVRQLLELVDRYSLPVVHSYMGHIQRAAEAKMRAALLRIPVGEHAFVDHLDDGTPIAVTVTICHTAEGGEATVDFAGTGPVLPSNLNANHAIVTSAVLYCFRCLIDEPIPLNAGVLAPITLLVPTDCLLNPTPHDDPAQCAAVVGGNVETSQRIVDVLLGALGVAAASQGTMNNFLFGRDGDRPFGYYETIGGGSGAGPDFDGASAVHTHMTNTSLTDPEVLEDRYPVRLRRFAIRRGSGGAGRQRGGDGMIRSIEFLEPLTVSLLTQRRTKSPYGLAGGQPGQPGENLLRRAGGETDESLASAVQFTTRAGDVLTLLTPGGGGFGTPDNR